MASIFPYLLGTNLPPSPRAVRELYRAVYEKGLQDGSLRPLVLMYHLYGFVLLVVYLCVSHIERPWLYKARWGVLAVIWWWQWRLLGQATSISAATGYAAGLATVWGMMQSATWLVWCRPQFEARRVARRRKVAYQNGPARSTSSEAIRGQEKREPDAQARTGQGRVYEETNGNGALHHRPQTNGHAKSSENGAISTNGHAKGRALTDGHANGTVRANTRATGHSTLEWEYYWQPYPTNFRDRIPWVLDLILNFRGPGWTWAIPPLPPLPPSIQVAISQPVNAASISGVSSVGLRRFTTRREMARLLIPRYIAGYFLLDVLKVILNKDPYFILGPNTYALPSHLAGFSPLALHILRITLNAAVVILSLEMVFMMSPIFFGLILGPSILGPWGEPWMYASTWGSFSNITRSGLNGLWGGWWHQIFRVVFAAPTNYFINNGYIKPQSSGAKFAALVFAFGISGALHAGGSTTTIPKTQPWEPPVFFALQGVGILLQTFFCATFRPQIHKFPRLLRQFGNLAFTVVWMYATARFLLDDFARGGMWLWEPIPISPLRGLGLGNEGDGWWCWPKCKNGGWLCWDLFGVGWYSGRHWWESGIAI